MNLFTKEWDLGKDFGILLLRVVFSVALLYGHGIDKLAVLFSGNEIQFLDPIGLGVHASFYLAMLAENLCSLLLILGLFTRINAAILAINFLVILVFHMIQVGDNFQVLEPRLFYFFAYLAFILTGGGKHSLDNLLFNKNRFFPNR